MKKVILILFCLTFFLGAVSCNKRDKISVENSSTEEIPSVRATFNNNRGQQENDNSTDEKESIQTEQFRYFDRAVDGNPYDKWLKGELEKGERAEQTIYAEYLTLWKDELAFTIEGGKVIFDDEEQYEQWKNDIEQWLVISQDILKTEMNMMKYSLGQLEVIVPYCEMVRQKAIDAKWFVYYYQVIHTLTPYTDIEIDWCSKHSQAMPDDYLQIIKSEKPFLLMGEEVLLEHYKSPYLQKYLNQCDTVQYTVLDMDGDGEEEVLIRGWTDDILVLHEEDGVVYGFDFTFREMYNVKTEGSYCWNANQGKSYGCSKLLFRKGTCFKIELSRVEHTDNGTDCYFVNGTEVDREAYDSFTESCVDVDYVTWYPLYLFPKNMEDKG